MYLSVILLCLVASVIGQTSNHNGNPTGEIGSPAFDEIIVESSLTVRGKSGSRSSKALSSTTTTSTTSTTTTTAKPDVSTNKTETTTEKADASSSLTLKRSKRIPRQRYNPHGGRHPGGFDSFPSASSSASHASSNAFQSNTPFGSFGAAGSQASSQSQSFGPGGFQSSAGQSMSQTYNLPNGNKIDVSFANSFGVNNGRPNFSNSHALTVTNAKGEKYPVRG